MHVAVFCDFDLTLIGGVQSSINAQIRGLQGAGHTVSLVCPESAKGYTDVNGQIISLPTAPLLRPNGYGLVVPSMRNQRIIAQNLEGVSLIHAQTNLGVGLLAIDVARQLNVPLVQTMHGRDDVFLEKNVPFPGLVSAGIAALHRRKVAHSVLSGLMGESRTAKRMWRVMVNHAMQATVVTVPSRHFIDKFQAHGCTRPMRVISNGISDTYREQLKAAPVSSDGLLRAMWCGRIAPEKRPLVALQAIEGAPGFSLDVYGEGPAAPELKEYVAAHKLSSRIRFHGSVSQSEILTAMTGHDVLLYTSHGFDNQPMVLLEATAAGLPVIYCDTDLSEVVTNEGSRLVGSAASDFQSALSVSDIREQLGTMRRAILKDRSRVWQSTQTAAMIEVYEEAIKLHHNGHVTG